LPWELLGDGQGKTERKPLKKLLFFMVLHITTRRSPTTELEAREAGGVKEQFNKNCLFPGDD
jgi:hypothetical protein